MAGDAARQQPNVPGANGQRRAVANGANGAQPTETGALVPMREPLRFEGFYLQPGAFVPWVGGQVLARDPTQPNYTMPRGFQQQQQRPRHTPVPSTSTGVVNPAAPTVSVAPTPPAIISPPPMSASASGSFVWPPTQTTIAPLPANPVPKTQPDPKAKASEDEETSSTSDSDAGDMSLEEKLRMAHEAVMKRLQSMGARGTGAPSPAVSRTQPE